MKKNILLSLVGLFLLGGAVFFLSQSHAKPVLGDTGAQPIYTPAPSTGVLCANTSTQVVATSTSRNFIVISNASKNDVYLSLGTPAVLYTGIYLTASSTITLEGSHLYSGAIYCIAATNSSTTVSESK